MQPSFLVSDKIEIKAKETDLGTGSFGFRDHQNSILEPFDYRKVGLQRLSKNKSVVCFLHLFNLVSDSKARSRESGLPAKLGSADSCVWQKTQASSFSLSVCSSVPPPSLLPHTPLSLSLSQLTNRDIDVQEFSEILWTSANAVS